MTTMDRIDRITGRYQQTLYSVILSNEGLNSPRAQAGFRRYEQDIMVFSREYMTTKESISLLEKSILINAKAFFVALKACKNFRAFTTVLDDLEPRLQDLTQAAASSDRLRTVQFFALSHTEGMYCSPSLFEFNQYKAMRDEMLAQSDTPSADIVVAVVNQFIDQFAEEHSADSNPQCSLM